MQHTQLLLIIEFVFLGIVLSVWFVNRRRAARSMDLHSGAAHHRRHDAEVRRRRRAIGRRAAPNVPIPWGWPNCETYRDRRDKPTVSEAMHNLAWVLLHEKQLASNQAADPRITNSIRALLEDRYHPVDKNEVAPLSDRQGRPALKSVPDDVPDQMDNFARQQSINGDVWLEGVGPVDSVRQAADRKYRKTRAIRELKRPWGW